MAYRVADAKEVELWRGGMRRMRRALGIESFGVNQLELPPNNDGGYPEHDETGSNHDELYICISGGGSLIVDGEAVELRPGRYVYVSPDARRRVISGDQGLGLIAVGAPASGERGGWEDL